MKTFLIAMALAFMALPAMAADPDPQAGSWMKPVESKYICMMNDRAFDKEQMAITVEGKTYYGCCPMCKDMLEKDASKRTATDPVSGKAVDKASAVIGADPHGMTYYFENKENFDKFASGPMPEETHDHMEHMEDMNGGMMHNHGDSGMTEKPAAEPQSHEGHH